MDRVVCVYGAPCSGKTTYVSENAQNEDIVWDFDKIRMAITLHSDHTESTNGQTKMVLNLRKAWADAIHRCDAPTGWFVCTNVTDEVKEMLGEDVEYHYMDVTKEECLRRLEEDDTREDKEFMRDLIEEYFSNKRGETMSNKEIRAFNFEVRAEENEEHGHFLSGVPIVYDARTDLGWYDEIIEKGALDEADLKDVRFLINHNTDMIPLARSRNNNENSTMQMSVDDNGMNIRVDLDIENNAEAKSLYSAVERGDLDGMSFMFTVDADKWDDIESEHPTRTITKLGRIFEVSAVTFPAYEQTSITARGLSEALESAKESLESEKAAKRAIEVQKQKIRILLEVEKWN